VEEKDRNVEEIDFLPPEGVRRKLLVHACSSSAGPCYKNRRGLPDRGLRRVSAKSADVSSLLNEKRRKRLR